MQDIRSLSAEIAAAVIKTAAADGHVCDEAAEQVAAGHEQLLDWVRSHMFTPTYSRWVLLRKGMSAACIWYCNAVLRPWCQQPV
jgi:hypothetical protein